MKGSCGPMDESEAEMTQDEVTQLREVVAEGVYRGVMKAVAIYALISLGIALVAWVVVRIAESPFFTT